MPLRSIIPSEGASGVAQMFTEVLLTGSALLSKIAAICLTREKFEEADPQLL
jgi:hypothetical protein